MAPGNPPTTLPYGRALDYDEHCPPGGKHLLYFHGTLGSLKEWLLLGSEVLAEGIGFERVALLAYSGGVTYAMASPRDLEHGSARREKRLRVGR